MNTFYLFPLFIRFFATGSCLLDSPIQNETGNQIVVFFDQAPVNFRNTLSSGTTMMIGNSEIRYLDDNLIEEHFTPQYAPHKDTLVIKCQREWLELRHAFKGAEEWSFLFQKGDSVLFTYNGQLPIAKVINRTTSPYETNYNLKRLEEVYQDTFSATTLFIRPSLAMLRKQGKTFSEVQDFYFKKALLEFQKEEEWLDSLLKNKVISEKTYQFYKIKNEIWLISIKDFKVGILKLPNRNESLLKFIKDHINPSESKQIPDEALQNMDFKGLVTEYFNSKVNRIRTSNSNLPNYKAVYDSIYKSTILSKTAKESLLFETINQLVEQGSMEEIKAYSKKFDHDIENASLKNAFQKNFNLDFSLSNHLLLKDTNGDTLLFSDVLKQLKNKVIYLDFWASWCAPCIGSLPASLELKNKYDKVEFIYLSIDQSNKQWIQAAARHKINNPSQSFLILNRYTSAWLSELRVNTIPRYLIFNKQGILIHKNAPGPGSEETKKLLDKYLNE